MPPLLNPVFLPFPTLSLSLSLSRVLAILFGYPCRLSHTVRMDDCVEGTLEKSPLTSAFPSFQPSTIDADCFSPPLPLPLVSRASSKPVLCFKEIPSSPLLAQGSLDQMTSSCKRSHLRFFLPRRDKDNFPCVLRFSVRLEDCIFFEFCSTNERFT